MKKAINLLSIGTLTVMMAFAYFPTNRANATEAIDGSCDLKKGCWFNDGCKEKKGGCCIGPADC